MGHAMYAHKNRARTITASQTTTTCGTITVTEDNGGSTPGDGGGGGSGGDNGGDTGGGDNGGDTGGGDDPTTIPDDPGGDDSDGDGLLGGNAGLLGVLAIAAIGGGVALRDEQ